MIVKDAEAPEYECPQAITSDKYAYCRGSRCMAWRWADMLHAGAWLGPPTIILPLPTEASDE